MALSRTSRPEYITAGKIPDSNIVVLDELFKSNEGILNSLLKALNERVYTNEGMTIILKAFKIERAGHKYEKEIYSEPRDRENRAAF